jgi:hypothetical protein
LKTLEYVRRDDGKTNWIVSENGNILDIFPDKWAALDAYPEAEEAASRPALSQEDRRANIPAEIALAVFWFLFWSTLWWALFLLLFPFYEPMILVQLYLIARTGWKIQALVIKGGK